MKKRKTKKLAKKKLTKKLATRKLKKVSGGGICGSISPLVD